MEMWVPLIVATVAAVASISVAFWNSRGESAELRQLKGMNEVLANLKSDSEEKRAFTNARDALLVRVAARTIAAPARRRLAVFTATLVFGTGMLVVGVAILWPTLSPEGTGILSAVGALAAAAGGLISGYRANRAARGISEREAEADRTTTRHLIEILNVDPPETKGSTEH